MIYVSNVKCGCGNFLLATKSGFMCPHCANQFDHDELRTCGDLIEISISAEIDWYEQNKETLKSIAFLDFLGFDDLDCIDGYTFGIVDFGMESPTHDQISKLVSILDPIVDERCTHMTI